VIFVVGVSAFRSLQYFDAVGWATAAA